MNPNCSQYFDGMFNTNFMNTLKGIRRNLQLIIQDWNEKRGNWSEVLSLINQDRFLTFPAHFQYILTTMYYLLVDGASHQPDDG